MKYFKNTELAKLYHVSEKSVRNWVEAAETGKLELQLFEKSGKNYIANTSKNTVLVENLVEKGKKFKNSRGYKLIQPTDRFYKLYNTKQVLDIISNMDNYAEIPLQYCYFDGGAKQWDSYIQHLSKETSTNPLSNTWELLELSWPYLDMLLAKSGRINVVDIGVGNALPVRHILQHLIDYGRLNRYIGIDISSEMLATAKKNIDSWFNGKIKFEGYVKDFGHDRFDDLLVKDQFDNSDSVINLVFFLGGTLNNLREPDQALKTIHDGLSKKDVLLLSKKLDTQRSRMHFDVAGPGGMAITLVLELLNIDDSYYEIEQIFDEDKMAREVKARLKIAIALEFNLDGQKRTVEFNKDDSILLWRARHQGTLEALDQLHDNGFEVLSATRSKDQDYLLTISKIRTER